MKKQTFTIALLFLMAFGTAFAQKTFDVDSFDKVIISPHIEVTFIEGTTPSVSIEKSKVSDDKLNVEVNGKTLRVYLDGAKDIPKNKKEYKDGYKVSSPLYKGTQVTATVTYVKVDEYSLRGDEQMVFKSKIDQDELRLKIYGESNVTIEELQLKKLHTTIYGESFLEVNAGNVENHKITAYGESRVHMEEINNNNTKLTAYGEAEFLLNTSDQLKITAFGEAVVGYRGAPDVKTGLTVGDVKIYTID